MTTPAALQMRVDSWLWAVRLAKTRSSATSACRAGHIQLNGERIKAAHAVKVGDELRIRTTDAEKIVRVTKLVLKRVGAPVAAECYTDLTPPPPPKEERSVAAVRDRGAGRPTKRERRDIERLRGR